MLVRQPIKSNSQSTRKAWAQIHPQKFLGFKPILQRKFLNYFFVLFGASLFTLFCNEVSHAQVEKTDSQAGQVEQDKTGDSAELPINGDLIDPSILDSLMLDPPPLTEPETLSIAKTLSPFEAFQKQIAQAEGDDLMSPKLIAGSLLPEFDRNKSEISQATSRLRPKHVFGEAATLDPKNLKSEDLVFDRFVAVDLNAEYLAKYKRNVASSYLDRARLLHGLGAFDFAEKELRKSMAWGSDQESELSLETNPGASDAKAQKLGDDVIRKALELAAAAEDGEHEAIRIAFDSLIRNAVMTPNHTETLLALCRLCEHKEFVRAFVNTDKPPEEFEAYQNWRSDLIAVLDASDRIMCECASRLSIQGNREGMRIRARQLNIPGLEELALIESKKLVSKSNASAEDWYIHANALSQQWQDIQEVCQPESLLIEDDEPLPEELVACNKALALDNEYVPAIYLRINIRANMLSRLHEEIHNRKTWSAIQNDLSRIKLVIEKNPDKSPIGLPELYEIRAGLIKQLDYQNVKDMGGVPNDSLERKQLCIDLLEHAVELVPENHRNRRRNLQDKIYRLKDRIRQERNAQEFPMELPSE